MGEALHRHSRQLHFKTGSESVVVLPKAHSGKGSQEHFLEEVEVALGQWDWAKGQGEGDGNPPWGRPEPSTQHPARSAGERLLT